MGKPVVLVGTCEACGRYFDLEKTPPVWDVRGCVRLCPLCYAMVHGQVIIGEKERNGVKRGK